MKFLLYKWLRVVYASHLRNFCFYGTLMLFVRCFSSLLTIFTHMEISMLRKARPKIFTHCYWSVRVLSIVCHTFFNTYPFEGSSWRSNDLDLNSPTFCMQVTWSNPTICNPSSTSTGISCKEILYWCNC